MRDTVGILVVLTFLVRVNGEAPLGGFCIEEQCFAVFQEQTDFRTAQKNCEKNEHGHLMTVRSLISHSVLLLLLGVHTGNYWIGLHLPSGKCPNNELGLRGFRWITGENETMFQNWRNFDDACSSKCISVSKYDFIWKEQACNSTMDGFICEYEIESPCQRIDVVDESVLYKTPLEFEGDNLLTLPQGTIASLKLFGSKFICFFGKWMKAPWSCEVFNGGCAYNCTMVNNKHVCTCPPGKTLQDNNVTCEDDPCYGLGCAHFCLKEKDIYTCMCKNGYTLAENGKECEELNYCVDDRLCPGLHSKCVNMPALEGFECRCQNGYELENDTCVDVDECFMSQCEHHCTNTDGSYTCYCNPGFIPMPEHPNRCEFVCLAPECRPICDRSADYQCKCPEGYVLDNGDLCVDIDECTMGHCHHDCTNTYGSYRCFCKEGYDLVGKYTCVKREPFESSGLTTPYSRPTPSFKHPTETPSTVKAGVFLGTFVCIVIVIFVMITLIHLALKRRGKLDIAFERQSANFNVLQKISSDKYKNKSFDKYVIYDNQYVID